MFFLSKSKERGISVASKNSTVATSRLQKIRARATDLETGVFDTKSHAESALVMENILRGAIDADGEQTIQLYAFNLNGDYSAHGFFMKTLHHYFSKTTNQIEVLIDEKPINSPHAIKAYDLLELYSKSKRFKNRLSLKMIRPEKKEHLSLYLESCNAPHHFMTGTAAMFYAEENRRTALASYSFCNEAKTNNLSTIFDFIFNEENGFVQAI